MGTDWGACGHPTRRLRAALALIAVIGALAAAPGAFATITAKMATPFIKRGLATGTNLLQQYVGVGKGSGKNNVYL